MFPAASRPDRTSRVFLRGGSARYPGAIRTIPQAGDARSARGCAWTETHDRHRRIPAWIRCLTACVCLLATGPALRSQPACVSPPASLVTWWPGDDHALDLAGLNHAALRNGATYTTGRVGRAFDFRVSGASVQAPAWGLQIGLQDFSIVGWLRTTTTADISSILTFQGTPTALQLVGPTGSLRLATVPAAPASGFNDGIFHHFAVTRKSGLVSFYKDGVVMGTVPFGENLGGSRVLLGVDAQLTNGFVGALDEVALFATALSADDIRALASAASPGWCKPATPALPFFVEAEDFDYGGGQTKADASVMPYLGGAYAGESAVAGIDYNDPGANESPEYRPASQGVGLTPSWDTYRDGYDVLTNHRIGWCDSGDWFNYTRTYPEPARPYHIYVRMASGGLPSAVQLDAVTAGTGTTNQTLAYLGVARGPVTGGWDTHAFVPLRDDSGQIARVTLGGRHTLRLTVLAGGNEDINYIQLVPADPTEPAPSTPCFPTPSDAVARWPGDGHARDLAGSWNATPAHGATYTTNGLVNDAFELDGVDDYFDTALDVQPSALPTTTWECWVFPSRVAGGRFQILSCDDGGFDRSVLVEGSAFGVFVGWGVWYPVGISPNQWQHIAVVYTPTNALFYKNGMAFHYPIAPAGQPTANRLQIGRNPGYGEYFQGRIDEVGIYGRALSATEVQAIHAAGYAGRCATNSPSIDLQPRTLDFGTTEPGTSRELPLTVRNTGQTTLTITSLTTDHPAFSVAAPVPPLSLATGASAIIRIAFAPTQAGTHTATLRLASNDPLRPSLDVSLAAFATNQASSLTVSHLEPDRGNPGTVVVFHGQGFDRANPGARVEFNGMSAVVLATTPSELLAVVPTGLGLGPATVRIQAADGSSANARFEVTGTETVALSVARFGTNVSVSWPTRAGAVQLDTSPSLSPPIDWVPSAFAATLAGESMVALIPAADSSRFFRLRPTTTTATTATADVPAATGGTVVAPGGKSTLTVPPGALERDTHIEVVSMEHASHPELPFSSSIRFSPPGLTFRQPATFTFQLPPAAGDPSRLEIYSISAANEPLRSGAEQSQVRRLTQFTWDAATRTVRVPIHHFSFLDLLARRAQPEIVFDFPGQYLKKADLIYTLTTDPILKTYGWMPGHCGLYLGTLDPTSTSNDGATIIESTSADTSPEKKFGGYRDGVQVRTDFFPGGGAFKSMSGLHLYMGARRPYPEPTDEQRSQAAAWALARTNTPYASLGGVFLSSGENGLSCVGLTERAYESAGRNLVPGFLEAPLMPARQFAYTEPVTEITIDAGKKFVMDVYGVVAPVAGEFNRAHPNTYNLRMSVDATTPAGKVVREGRARLSPVPAESREFVFEPNDGDAELGYVFRFTLEENATATHLRTKAFLIHVRPRPAKGYKRQDPPHIAVNVFTGSASPTNLLVTATEATTTGPSASRLRLFWDPPPATLAPGATFTLGVQADPGTAPQTQFSSLTAPPRLMADIEQFPDEFGPTTAFVGYQAVTPCNSPFGQSCYELLSRPASKQITVPADPTGDSTFRGVMLQLRLFKSLGTFNPVEIRATVTWTYTPEP